MELHKGQRVICVNADWSAAIEHQPRLIDAKLPVQRAPYYVASCRREVHNCGAPGCNREGVTVCWVTIVGLDPQLNFDGDRFVPAVDDASTDISVLKEIARTTKLPPEGLMSPKASTAVKKAFNELSSWARSRKQPKDDA